MSVSGIDKLDLEIINYLRDNCRVSIRELAKALGKPPSTIADRVKRLEKRGLIKKCAALLNHDLLGYKLNALTLLQVDGAYIEEVEKILSAEPNVRAVYDITGEYDIAVISIFRDTEELNKFIKRILKIPYIKRSVTSVILRIVKETPNIENIEISI